MSGETLTCVVVVVAWYSFRVAENNHYIYHTQCMPKTTLKRNIEKKNRMLYHPNIHTQYETY